MLERIERLISRANEIILAEDPTTMSLENILNGKLGLALYCIKLYKLTGNTGYLDKIKDILEDIFKDIEDQSSFLATKMTLADGLPGLGIILNECIKEKILEEEFQEQVNTITAFVFQKCTEMINNELFDYFYGAWGLLFYLTEINQYDYCNTIVDQLQDYAVNHDYLFYNNTQDSYTQGINFGFAHGTLAILAILIKIYETGKCNNQKIKPLILHTIDNLLRFRRSELKVEELTVIDTLESSYITYFPYNVISDDRKTLRDAQDVTNHYHYSGRLGWCNSDLSLALILYKAGNLFKIEKYTLIAKEVGMETIQRNPEKETRVENYFMCHGSSGVAQLYGKIYDETNDEAYKEAYERWTGITLGYLESEMLTDFKMNKADLLTGWLGALLSLYTYAQKEEVREWDNIFLI